ncbi:alkaline phosphatase PhoX [Nonomuraea jiangxiensis]|uniref:WD40-like Beta Propeller Repeat n=1 Tax=Nonomuraea jiangxiensis TaxID=633440 RepID=A0A1G8T085_9ACTN|nr:alkaline phosphatase PhoX [Nonomuraea jiangxiensis]SDJ34851.1 WD40-like Beta Propeller Repeat [Nonomuraea jiangxiensis]
MRRRTFLSLGAVAFSGAVWHEAAVSTATHASVAAGASPYGPLGVPDANGMALPAGFTGRIVARTGHRVGGTLWHPAPDGGACFADGTGWIYVSNSEVPLAGGASAIKFRADGSIERAYRILNGTNLNCAGGATPWNTWLSCEEIFRGRVFETDPYGTRSAQSRPAMGRFKHEAAACDPDHQVIYLTEDETDGCFYRFTPTTWGELSSGRLDVLCGLGGDAVDWRPVPDPAPGVLERQTRHQVSAARHFNGGEGCHYAAGVCYFTAKGDRKVWAYDTTRQTVTAIYDGTGTLDGVDNITGRPSGDLYVAEDGGNMEINIITPDGVVAPVMRLDGQSESEITGPAFSPDGTRLYFSSQRGTSGESLGSGGITYEVTGPFRR